jgi:hypothetical protein
MRTNDRILAVAASATTMLLVTGSTSSAEPLRNVVEPLCSSVDTDFAHGPRVMSPNCSAPVADGHRGTLEISLTATRGPTQIGDFKIAGADLYNGSYIPEVWSVDPGDNILIHFENRLSGPYGFRTNLHTHGMIVSPNNAPGTPKTPVGDNVYVLIESENAPVDDHMTHVPANMERRWQPCSAPMARRRHSVVRSALFPRPDQLNQGTVSFRGQSRQEIPS